MAHVLIIEPDSLTAAVERDFLENRGFEVFTALSLKEGLKIFDHKPIEAVLLSVDLPDGNGLTLCRRLRTLSALPILFISSRGEPEDVLKGFAAGADDYIIKPFNPTIMLARLQAHLNMYLRLLKEQADKINAGQPDIQAGDLAIYLHRHQVFRRKKEIFLTGKEFNLLVFLASHPNQVFSKKYLFEMIWHLDPLGELATVTVHVNRLRDKLNEVKPEFTAIETVWGNGYRFRLDETE